MTKTNKVTRTPSKSNPRDLWPETWQLIHWLHFWQFRTAILTFTLSPLNKEWRGQHSQFLRCLPSPRIFYQFMKGMMVKKSPSSSDINMSHVLAQTTPLGSKGTPLGSMGYPQGPRRPPWAPIAPLTQPGGGRRPLKCPVDHIYTQ